MIHIIEMFGDRFKTIQTYGVIEQISLRYAQYHEASDVTLQDSTRFTPWKKKLTSSRSLPNGVDKWGPGIKEMDSAEENYFNGDEEEDISSEPLSLEDMDQQRVFELKRRRSTDDDGDDELSQLSQRSPQPKRECILVPANCSNVR